MTGTAPPPRRFALPVLAVLMVAASAGLFWDTSAREAAQRDGAQAVATARDAIPAIMSYQPATVEQELQAAARDRLASPFLDTYTQLIVTAIAPEIKQRGISAVASVPGAAVVSAGSGHAVLLVYVDQTSTVGPGSPTQTKNTVRVTMDHVDGRWLISGFEEI